jgi:glycerate kinase
MILSILDDFKFFSSGEKINKVIRQSKLGDYITSVYVSDGGPGFLNTDFLKNYKKVNIYCHNSILSKHKTYYKFDQKNKTAYIELAKICGIELVKRKNTNYFKNFSYGLGEAIKYSIKKGAKKIFIGLGANASSDVGIGVLYAFGVKFLDNENNFINIFEQGWNKIEQIDKSSFHKAQKKYKKINITMLADVILPLYGENGSTKVFGFQKGAKTKDINYIDDCVKKYYNLLKKISNNNLSKQKYGSSGGIPLSISAMFNTRLLYGIDFFIKKTKLKKIIKQKKIKYFLTGEGRLDSSSLLGKLPVKVSRFGKKNRIRTFGLFGQITNKKIKSEFFKCFKLTKKQTNLNRKFLLNNNLKIKIIKIGNKIHKLIN